MGQSKERREGQTRTMNYGGYLNTREAQQFSLFFHPPLMIMELPYIKLSILHTRDTCRGYLSDVWENQKAFMIIAWKNTKRLGEEKERETKTCIKVITGSSYSPAHFWCWWVAAIMHTIIWCCLFYKLDWLHFSWKTTKLVLIGTRHKQWWPFLCSCVCSKPTVASAHNSLKLHSNSLYWERSKRGSSEARTE